jgi:uncharacterized protein
MKKNKYGFFFTMLVLWLQVPLQAEVMPSVFVTMRDNIRLATDLYFPETKSDSLPVLLIRTPYGKENEEEHAQLFAKAGFVVAVQDTRGRGESEGTFEVFAHERLDGFNTIDWLAKQSWSNGRVGTFGCSALGQVQIVAAATRHPAHRAAIMSGHGGVSRVGQRYFRGAAYENGVLELAQNFGWLASGLGARHAPRLSADIPRAEYLELRSVYKVEFIPRIDDGLVAQRVNQLPLIAAMGSEKSAAFQKIWEDYVLHNPASAVWAQRDHVTDADNFDTPTLHVGAWYDSNSDGTVQGYHLMRERSLTPISRNNQYLLMHPGVHCAHLDQLVEQPPTPQIVGARDMGDTRPPQNELARYLQWFNFWLKDQGSLKTMPKVQVYEMGVNRWRDYSQWPAAGVASQSFYLHSDGNANSLFGNGTLNLNPASVAKSDQFVYDPLVPVPTKGGAISFDGGGGRSGPFDQREIEVRHDVLVYSSEALEKPLRIAGESKVILYVSSSALDTDFTAKLVDVTPDGTAYNLVETIVRMRWREGLQQERLLVPGNIYEIELPLPSTHIALQRGHRLRLEVSSSSFPRFMRNLNTGGDNARESKTVKAINKVFHSAKHPSRVVIQVLK